MTFLLGGMPSSLTIVSSKACIAIDDGRFDSCGWFGLFLAIQVQLGGGTPTLLVRKVELAAPPIPSVAQPMQQSSAHFDRGLGDAWS